MPTRPLLLLLPLLALAGCGSSATRTAPKPPYTVVTPGAIAPGSAIPRPRGKVVLTLTGQIARTNAPGGRLELDMPTLERLGLVEWTGSDKGATGRSAVRFRGVLLSRLLAVAGARRTATRLRTIALNDYKVTIPVSDARRFPVLVATTADGRRMPVAKYGPTRIVYPYGVVKGLAPTVYDPRSIWQLKTIDVR